MALALLSRKSGGFDEYLTGRIVITPVPVVRHPEKFTPARAGLVAVGVACTLLGAFAIICRLLTLIQRRRKIGYDDYAMFVAYTCSVAFTISTFISVRWGVGLELKDVPLFWAERAIQAVYANEVSYYITVFFIKLSLMCLYLRLGNELRGWFWFTSLALLGVIVLHFMTTVIVFSVQCMPMKKYWKPSTPGVCIDITAFFYSANIFTIVTDLIMIALPMPIIWKIPRPKGQKVGIMAAFMVAGLGTLASCIRLYSIKIFTDSRQPMRDAAPISTWSFIEINLGILCASIAVIKPVFTKTVAPSLAHEHQQRTQKRFSSTVYASPLSSIPSSRTNRKSQNTVSADSELEKVYTWSNTDSPVTPEKSPARDLQAHRKYEEIPIRFSSTLPEPPKIRQPNPKAVTALPTRPDEYPTMQAQISQKAAENLGLFPPIRQQPKAHTQDKLQLYSTRPETPTKGHTGPAIAGW